jgi:tetratricopeptide (TPR) repeat protein
MNRLRGWEALGLCIICLLAYAPSIGGEFLWDDDDNVTENPNLEDVAGLVRTWTDPRANQQYYPIVHTSFWVERQLFGLWAPAYRVTNVVLHALCAWLLLGIARRLSVPGAWLGALLFALHPVQVESVAWITERKNVLSTLLYLGAAAAYLRHDEAREQGGGRRAYALALLLFVLALLSKTVTATLPAALAVLLWMRHGRGAWVRARSLWPFALLAPVFGALTLELERNHVGAQGAAWNLDALQHAELAGRALWFYAGKLLWPHPLMFVYPRWQLSTHPGPGLLASVLALLLPLALWLLRRRLGPGPLGAVLIFGGTLVPALGFFNVFYMRYAYVQDHFQYLASAAPLLLFGAGLFRLGRVLGDRGRVLPGLLVVALLGGLTAQRARVFRDDISLFEDSIRKSERPALAHAVLASELLDRGHDLQALRHARLAVQSNDQLVEAHNLLGSALSAVARTHRDDPARARAMLVEAEAAYRSALEVDPSYADAHNNLGNVWRALGRPHEAVQAYRKAVQLAPGNSFYRASLATALQTLGRVGPALEQFRVALRLGAVSADVLVNYGVALAVSGDREAARQQFTRALQLQPGHPQAVSNLQRLE